MPSLRDLPVQGNVLQDRFLVLLGRVVAAEHQQLVRSAQVLLVAGRLPEHVARLHLVVMDGAIPDLRERVDRSLRVTAGEQREVGRREDERVGAVDFARDPARLVARYERR